MADWQVQEAKAKFSELVERAIHEGPQTITRHGKPRAVVLSMEEYRAMAAGSTAPEAGKPRISFKEFLLSGPKFDDDVEFDFERIKDYPRDIDFD
ncbi:prevent-host-death family protein [Kaistia hirudinis]|uniref:Antitoxin n=1 Tax=Kaistia hirudinis TaxID=1293440 RepID=A0A840AVY4_9HYPH|nr:type II toxin-antitoxin system Phd/YefM family antitoxin [Kaistia hirudinis]MBB3932951.1 prevent-host-death family protein [Kaistia hirudinis]